MNNSPKLQAHKERINQSYPTTPIPILPSATTVTCLPTIPVSEIPKSNRSGNSHSISILEAPG